MTVRKPLVYVAGPITLPRGRARENAVRACREAEHLMMWAGVVALIPHLSVFWVETMLQMNFHCLCGKKKLDHDSGLCHDGNSPIMDTALGVYDYEEWIDISANWLMRCDALYRMPGMSRGADREVALARELDIPVFFTVSQLKQWIAERPAA